MVAWLDGPEAMGTGHGDLQARLRVHFREQYRLLLQGRLDERARRELRRAEVIGSDGVPRPRVENGHECGLTSVFGAVTVTGKACRATPGATSGATTPEPCCPVREPGARPHQAPNTPITPKVDMPSRRKP